MFRWDAIDEITANGITMKFYRPMFSSDTKIIVNSENREYDDIAYKYLGSETDSYKIIDINFKTLMENRFNLSKITKVEIPNG